MELAAKVGVFIALGHSQAEAAERFSASPTEIRAAVERVRRASRRLDPALADF